jgi:hypothetical protein
MLKCNNCDKEAVYTCADPGLSPINYCANCLPVWLHSRAEAGHFPLAVIEKPETPAPKTKKKAAPSDENN